MRPLAIIALTIILNLFALIGLCQAEGVLEHSVLYLAWVCQWTNPDTKESGPIHIQPGKEALTLSIWAPMNENTKVTVRILDKNGKEIYSKTGKADTLSGSVDIYGPEASRSSSRLRPQFPIKVLSTVECLGTGYSKTVQGSVSVTIKYWSQ